MQSLRFAVECHRHSLLASRLYSQKRPTIFPCINYPCSQNSMQSLCFAVECHRHSLLASRLYSQKRPTIFPCINYPCSQNSMQSLCFAVECHRHSLLASRLGNRSCVALLTYIRVGIYSQKWPIIFFSWKFHVRKNKLPFFLSSYLTQIINQTYL